MTVVYVIRHPRTDWNDVGRYQGRLEAPLSREGRVQAGLLARTFAGQDIQAVVSSPLCRALIPARDIAAATDSPLTVDQRLTEIGLGVWEGLLTSEIRDHNPDLLQAWHNTPDEVHIPMGETIQAVAARAAAALKSILDGYPVGNVVVVTHSVVVRVLAAAALGLTLRHIHRLPASNAAMTVFCGRDLPGKVVWLNSLAAVYPSPVAAAEAAGCGRERGVA